MSAALLDSASGRLIAVPEGGPIGGDGVGIAAGGGHALLSVQTNELVRRPVRLSALPEVPAGVLAIGEGLAEELGLGASGVSWRLDPVDPVELRRLRLEITTEGVLDDAARALAGGLADRVLWCGRQESWIEVNGSLYRVSACDTGRREEVVGRITERTEVEVFAPGVRTGVDVVILADCSGSMDVWDIPVSQESVWRSRHPPRGITRMEALQKALGDLLDVRLRVDGRVSRVALVAFDEKAEVRFPPGGGMAELGRSAPRELVDAFRMAVGLLNATGPGTNIPNALHEAANLLYRYGHSGNERLIVLVSDGAHWDGPADEQSTGEIVPGFKEPVSLMEHLHQYGIRLHAIGISTSEYYKRWLATERRQFSDIFNPNHELLQELVRVGGGDPTAIGGMEVLASYFSGLGAGITRSVRLSRPAPAGGRPSDAAVAILRRLTRVESDGSAGRRIQVFSELGETVGHCVLESQRVFGRSLLDEKGASQTARRFLSERNWDERAFVIFARAAAAFRPGRAPSGAAQAVIEQQRALARLLDGLQEVTSRDAIDYPALGVLLNSDRTTDSAAAIDTAAARLLTMLKDWAKVLRDQPDFQPTADKRAATEEAVGRDVYGSTEVPGGRDVYGGTGVSGSTGGATGVSGSTGRPRFRLE
jgi:Mg-chelatase subunit ChlD